MFVVIGVIGAVLLVSTLVFDDVIDEIIPDLDFLSGPVIGAFLAAFGLFGWFLDDGLDSAAGVAVLAAIGGGVLFGAVTFRLTRTLMHQPTDGTPTTASLVGKSGKVVTPIRANGLGEVLVTLGGAAYEQYGQAAILDLLAEMLPQLVKEAAAPLANVDKMTIISTDGASQLTKHAAQNVTQGLQLASDLLGIDLAALFRNLANQGVNTELQPPVPPA